MKKMFLVIIIALSFLLISCSSNRTYSEYPNVPDFGAIYGHENLSQESGSYQYNLSDSSEDITSYLELLLKNDFEIVDQYNNSVEGLTDIRSTFSKDDTTVEVSAYLDYESASINDLNEATFNIEIY